MLVELLAPAGILARNDPKVRALEGLEQTVEVLHGTIPESVVVREGPVEYDVDLRRGQKTGLFLDQRENREAAARYAHGRLLDCFSYNGGFALRLARQCRDAEAIDISADAVARIRANAERNGVPHLQAREANVFDELRRLERAGARYDTIVLDPPAFAKNKASIPNALAGYKEINLRAMRLLSPGGYLITCSCSYNVNEEMFAAVLHEASVDSHTPVTIVEKRMQGRDHPVLVGVPETLLPEVLHPAESRMTSSKEAEKTYLGLTGSSAWEQAKPFSHAGADTLADSAQLLHDFAVAMMALQPAPGDLILDLGAGGCWCSDLLRKLHRRSVAVDISLEMLRAGRSAAGRCGHPGGHRRHGGAAIPDRHVSEGRLSERPPSRARHARRDP